MPYERSRPKLKALIEIALNEEEIRNGVSQTDLGIDDLRERFLEPGLDRKAPTIWEAGTAKIERYNKLENEYEAFLSRLRREEEQMRFSYLRMPRWTLATFFVALPIVLVLATLGVIWVILPATSSWFYLTVTVAFSALAAAVYIVIFRSLYRRSLAAKDRYDERLVEIRRERETSTLGEQLETAEKEVERAVIEGGILRDLRDIIGEYMPSYDTTLKITSAPGLAEVFDPAYEISTEPKEKLHRLLTNMPGGSIGISGPRGVGKTTLMASFCGKTTNTKLKNRPVLSVMLSAPVEYDPREFVLHVFSSVCRRVLQIKDKEEDPESVWRYMRDMRRFSGTFFSTAMGPKEALGVVALGLILISTLLISGPMSSLKLSDFYSDFFVGMGVFIVLLGSVGLLISIYQVLEDRRRSSRKRDREKQLYGNDLLVETAYERLRDIQFQQSYSSGWAGTLKANITPVAAETAINTAIDLSENQKTLPEIVELYQEFLTLASKEYVIIIGIDELDKIRTDEDAMKFLNEIKALFGLESCFYLISVSESAMSSFERRGLHFRDVFDSSFDAIVHADYLDLERSHRLLRRRVIGVPVPFLDLCHCMVGGLPRDLIRVFRALYEAHTLSEADGNDLSSLCGALIREDLKAKLWATSVAAERGTTSEAEMDDLLGRLNKIETLLDEAKNLPTICPDLLEAHTALLESANPGRQGEAPAAEPRGESLASLRTELAIYLYYCATLLEFFGREEFDVDTLKEAEGSGRLEQLARVRQYVANSPRMAESAIKEFRKQYDMTDHRGVPTIVASAG
jgi:GTPase SAR1 family protein/membrane protein implicated in regulation of membrane protease activity